MRPLLILLAPVLTGCIKNVEGPFLGTCADHPDGAYTFGEVGIGTCLAGPADVRFIEQDGSTWLVVSNADPYLNFTSGSVLLIDWDSIDFDRLYNRLGDLEASALPLPRFVGQFGYSAAQELLLVTNRLSEGATTRSHDDRGFLVDVSDPRAPRPFSGRRILPMQDDPYLVVVDPSEDIAYVGNLTDHSISLFDLADGQVSQIPVHPKTVISDPVFLDADDSGSLGTIESITITDDDLVDRDLWTLTFVDKLVRLWVPTPASSSDDDAIGLVRWTSGSDDFVPSGIGLELDPTRTSIASAFEDPFVFQDSSGLLQMFYADQGVIRSLLSQGAAADWSAVDRPPFRGSRTWDDIVASPSAVGLSPTLGALYYDGRTDLDSPASIGLALTEDGANYTALRDPVITDPAGALSFEHPFVLADPLTASFRMWMSVFDGERWRIALAESANGQAFTDPVVVLEDDDLHVAGPTVAYVNGRYVMYLTVADDDDDLGWIHATTWSYDGISWSEPELLFDSEVPFDLEDPPRLGLQIDASNGWRMVGRDEGPVETLIPAGVRFVAANQGLSLSIATGQEVDNGIFPDGRAMNGLEPGSIVEIDGRPTLYVTATGADSRERIGVLRRVGESWAFLESNVIPSGSGGNIAGVRSPLVVEAPDGTFVMFYTAKNAEDVSVIRRAVSTDGRAFEPLQGEVVDSEDDWDDVAMEAHSIELLPGGRVRLWYSGFDGSRWRIGSAEADDLLARFAAVPGAVNPWQLGEGPPGGFDDSGVRDPMVFVEDGVTQMYYAGFDGLIWQIGHAVRRQGQWVRRTAATTEQAIASMPAQPGTFFALGADNPVLQLTGDDEPTLWFSGTDGQIPRLGRAIPRGEVVFPAQRFPTPFDQFTFQVIPGGPAERDIRLNQVVHDFATTGTGMSGMTLDPERGFLYVASKLANFLYVIDVRDDTSGTLDDANFRDIETLLVIEADNTPLGFRDVLVDPVRDRLYATSRDPEGVMVFNLDDIVDNDRKEVTRGAAEAVLPMLDLAEDAGVPTLAQIGGNGMALHDNRFLLVTHHRNNALWVYDLELGSHGELVARIPHIGENPHLVRISPDGRFAVVANYLGDVDSEDTVSSTLAVVDLDPSSESFLEVVTWLVNR